MITELGMHTFFTIMRKQAVTFCYTRHVVAATDPRRQLGDFCEREAALRLSIEGYDVVRTSHNERFDLLIDGCLRIEVKAARWDGRRYQAHFHNQADVIAWQCVNTGDWFIVPCRVLDGRRNLAIWSYNPSAYKGQWARFLNAWTVITDLVDKAKRAGTTWTYQARLF